MVRYGPFDTVAHDPTDKKKFISDDNKASLEIDCYMPDQFNPTYWTAIFMILINTGLGIANIC